MNIPLQIIGWGEEWKGLGQKLTGITNAVQQLPDNTIVMFTDAYDILFTRNASDLLRRYRSFSGSPLIFSAECGCSPQSDYDPMLCLHDYPSAPTLYRYLNSGAWIGLARDVRRFLQAVLSDAGEGAVLANDQELVNHYYIKQKMNITLDHHSLIFQSMHENFLAPLPICVPMEDLNYQFDGSWWNAHTGSTSAVFHFNGGGKKFHLTMDYHMWYKRQEYNTPWVKSLVYNSTLLYGGRPRSFKDICPGHLEKTVRNLPSHEVGWYKRLRSKFHRRFKGAHLFAIRQRLSSVDLFLLLSRNKVQTKCHRLRMSRI